MYKTLIPEQTSSRILSIGKNLRLARKRRDKSLHDAANPHLRRREQRRMKLKKK
jgi:hypothetical protein